MNRTRRTFLLAFAGLMLLVLAGCSAETATPTVAPVVSNEQGGTGPGNGGRGGFAAQVYTDASGKLLQDVRLAAGTLSLEGSDLAVTAEQAKSLLPLWQQVSVLRADAAGNAAKLLDAYKQIQAIMTADQLKAIDAFKVDDIQTMLSKYGRPNGGVALSDDQRATLAAQMQTRVPGGNGQGRSNPQDPQAQGTPGARGSRAQGTPPAGFQRTPGGEPDTFRGGQAFDFSFVNQLIALLQTRAAN